LFSSRQQQRQQQGFLTSEDTASGLKLSYPQDWEKIDVENGVRFGPPGAEGPTGLSIKSEILGMFQGENGKEGLNPRNNTDCSWRCFELRLIPMASSSWLADRTTATARSIANGVTLKGA
jgi:hypothetical protein